MTTPGPFILQSGHYQQEILIHNTQRVVYRIHNEGPDKIKVEWGDGTLVTGNYVLYARQSIDIEVYDKDNPVTQISVKLENERGLATGWFDRVDRISEWQPS